MTLSVWLAIFLLLFIPTVWAILHIAYRNSGSTKKKAIWGLFVVFMPPIGGIAYLLYYVIRGKASRHASMGQ